jgi:hypothetical protein
MFREARPTSTKKYEEKVRKDPVKSRRPDLPINGPGRFNGLAFVNTEVFWLIVYPVVRKKNVIEQNMCLSECRSVKNRQH